MASHPEQQPVSGLTPGGTPIIVLVGPSKSLPVNLYGTEAVPVVVGASAAKIALASMDVTQYSVAGFYYQLRGVAGTLTMQLGIGLEVSPDGVAFYPMPFIGAVDGTTPIFPATTGVGGPPPTDGGFNDAGETVNRSLAYDIVYFPVVAAAGAGATRSIMRSVPFTVTAWRFIRGVVVPLYTGTAPTLSVVANLAT